MKRILFLFILLCLENALHAQYIYTIKADSVKITNTCDTAELIIENHTQTVPGFLFNKGRGRTEFRRISQFDDTTVVIGGDTVHLGRGYKNFANADLTFDGDHFHNGAFHTLNLTDFDAISFKSNTAEGTLSSALNMNTGQFNLEVDNTSNPDNVYTASMNMTKRSVDFGTSRTTADVMRTSDIGISETSASIGNGSYDLNTGDGVSVGVIAGLLTDYDPREIDMYSNNGTMRIYTENNTNGNRIEMNFQRGDSLVINKTSGFVNDGSLFIQANNGFTFTHYKDFLQFKLSRLPASTSSSDSMLVIDDNGQVKKRAQSTTRKSTTVTASSYTVPADVDVVFVNCAGGTATISLPTGILDREIIIKNLNTTNTVALFGLDPSESNTIATHGAITVKYTGSTWVGISKY